MTDSSSGADAATETVWSRPASTTGARLATPVDGVVEYKVGRCWLQLSQGRCAASDWVFRIGVDDVRAERDRLLGMGIEVSSIEEVDQVIAFCTFADPDGNQFSLYTET